VKEGWLRAETAKRSFGQHRNVVTGLWEDLASKAKADYRDSRHRRRLP